MRIGVPLKVLGLLSAAAVLIEQATQVSADSSGCTTRYSSTLSAAVYYPEGFGLSGDEHLASRGSITRQVHRDFLDSECFDPYPCYTFDDGTQVKVATNLPTTCHAIFYLVHPCDKQIGPLRVNFFSSFVIISFADFGCKFLTI